MMEDFEKSFDLSSDLIFFPVRHHSPACSFYLKKVIDMYDPDCILIEGPSDADHLAGYLADSGTEPPVCIYSSFDDTKGVVSEYKEKYRAYYPFLAYSPEFCAVKEAVSREIEVHFIDMPFPLQLTMFGEERGRESLKDERAEYYRITAEKSGCRSFSEFWERSFEVKLGEDVNDFVRSVYMLGRYMRELSESDEFNECRESHMRQKIKAYSKQYSRILVVAGAYHIYGLMQKKKEIKMGRYASADSGLYLMPYTFAETDSRSGYGAGIPFPAFYSEVWKKLCAGEEKPYLKTAESFIVNTARYTRKKQPVSIPDETEAMYLAQSLAALRGKSEPGAFELIDGVRSAFVKGDINSTAVFELDHLYRRMTGLGAGTVNFSTDESIIPPCVTDFRTLCRKYRINIGNITKQTTVLDVVKKQSHYEKSCFFRRMAYLETGFCKMESGADHVSGRDDALIREQWSYRYSTNVETRLVDLSVYGVSVEGICRSLLETSYRKLMTAEEAGRFMLHLFTMGFSENADKFADRLYELIRDDADVPSQSRFMSSINKLINLHKHISGNTDDTVFELLKLSFETALDNLSDAGKAMGDSAADVCEAVRRMYSLSAEYPSYCSRNALMQELNKLAESGEASPMMYGVCLALQNKSGIISDEEHGEAVSIYMRSAVPDDSADFLSGLILAGRDIILTSSSVLESIDHAVKKMDNYAFMELLPKLRRAFTEFLPSETIRISKAVSELYGVSENALSGSDAFTAEEIICAMNRDKAAREIMEKWGMQID